MGLLDSIIKGVKTTIADYKTPDSFKIGQLFEEIVRGGIFPPNYYDLVEKTHDYQSNKSDFVESSKKPDFTFRDRYTKKQFFVEAKFRSTLLNGKIEWSNPAQIKRYQEIQKLLPVFILIGFYAEDDELQVFLIPLTAIKYTGIYPSFAKRYQIEYYKPITSKKLWDR
jgi:hypothetical protein